MSSPSLVDDSNPAVQYAPGWIWDQLAMGEVADTRHGAGISGLTAWLGFSGTGIQVVGTLEASNTSGRPTTEYYIDGALQGTYTAPYTPAGVTVYNVTFFSKLDLASGSHQINITNTNGTSPNTFWLDYLLVYTQLASGSAGPTPSPATGTASSAVSTSLSIAVTKTSTTGSPLSSSRGSASETSTAPRGPSVGAIVGGVLGAMVLILLALLMYFVHKRRRLRTSEDIRPFVLDSSNPGFAARSRMYEKSGADPIPIISDSQEAFPWSSAPASSTPREAPASSHDPSRDSLSHSLRSAAHSGRHEPVHTVTPGATGGIASADGEGSTALGPPSVSGPPTALCEEVAGARWYAPAATQSRARSLLQAFSKRRGGRGGTRMGGLERDIDSGMRLYNQPTLPPPYTAE